MRSTTWNPGVAAVLSFVVPGLGQIYKGWVGRGLLCLFLTLIGYFSLIIPGLILHVWAVVNAYRDDSRAEHDAKVEAKRTNAMYQNIAAPQP